MTNAQVVIMVFVALLALGIAVCWLIAWHERTYVRRMRPMHAVCSPAVSRAFIRACRVGGVLK